jgi:iron(III) transport system substrate-binding protein
MSRHALIPRCFRKLSLSAALAAMVMSIAVGIASQRPAAAQDDFQQKWQELIKAAQKEGELVIMFGGQPGRLFGPILKNFSDKFGVRVIAPPGNGTSLSNRLLAERQAGRYTADIIHMAMTSVQGRLLPNGVLDDLRPELIHPEVTNQSLWYEGKHWWADPEDKLYFIYGARTRPSLEVYYNTNVMTPADIAAISSDWDFLTDKWKGKFVALPPTHAGGGDGWALEVLNPALGKEWVRRFIAEMDVNFVTDIRQITDGLAVGRYAAAINVDARREFAALGAKGMPLALFDKQVKEPKVIFSTGQGMIGVATNRPHPNAARLFVNWLLSREGQTVRQAMSTEPLIPTLRIDDIPPGKTVPSEHVDPKAHLWFPAADRKFRANTEAARHWAKDVYLKSR